MKRALVALLNMIVVLNLAVIGCSQPSAAPSQPQAAPTKAAEPTKAATAPTAQATTASAVAQPTAAPAKKVDYPTKGKSIKVIVPSAAGGGLDIGSRLAMALVEKDLGVSIGIVNRPGAGNQLGLTELVQSAADGYTIGHISLPTTITVYLDPDRKAVFGRNSFQVLPMHVIDPALIAVSVDSPYKTLRELTDAAKAKPNSIKVSTTGILSDDHLTILLLEQMTGCKFAAVHFDGPAPGMTALLGGHIDAYTGNIGDTLANSKNGKVRVLGVATKEESSFLPGVKTFGSQGFNLVWAAARVYAAPAGMPKEAVGILAEAMKNAIQNPDHQQKMAEQGMTVTYMGPAEAGAYWDDMETKVKPLMSLAKEQ